MTLRTVKSLLALGGLCLILTSCKGGAGSSAFNSVGIPDRAEMCAGAPDCVVSGPEVYYAPSIMKATSADITYNKVTCSGNDSGKVCVLICHRPPGNPSNSKTMVLPLPAVFAHLKHGNSKVPDTIGTCDDPMAEDPDMDEEPTMGDDEDMGEGEEGDEADEGEDHEDGEDSDLPTWCQENLEIDSDCDGIGDGPGVPPVPIY